MTCIADTVLFVVMQRDFAFIRRTVPLKTTSPACPSPVEWTLHGVGDEVVVHSADVNRSEDVFDGEITVTVMVHRSETDRTQTVRCASVWNGINPMNAASSTSRRRVPSPFARSSWGRLVRQRVEVAAGYLPATSRRTDLTRVTEEDF